MLEDILAHPQIAANGAVVEREDARRGRIRTLAPPVKMTGTPTGVERLAPALGEHTDEVLREFGVADAELRDLHAARVI
jgi:crotonobetainyl-CoA:carnitine CoA-transferase CaiB-like acyl-CoA transferase